jgi:hypothetical protein
MAKSLSGKSVKAKRMGDVQVVDNQAKKPAAAPWYNFLRVQLETGKEVRVLLTDGELRRGMERAEKNPEDCPKVSVVRDLFD